MAGAEADLVSSSDFMSGPGSPSDTVVPFSGVLSLTVMLGIIGGGGGIFFVSSSLVTLAVLLAQSLPPMLPSIFLRFPFGAGSRLGVVLLYVTVRVTAYRTLTGLLHAERGVVAMLSNTRLD